MLRRLTYVLPLAVAMAACGEDGSTWVSPGPVPPHPLVLTGTVYEHTATGARPLANIPLAITQEEIGPGVAGFISDSQGRYRAEFAGNLSPAFTARVMSNGYQQPCRAALTLRRDIENVLDVHVVGNAILLTSGMPRSLPITEPSIYGQILERSGDEDAPIQGARVSGEFIATLEGDYLADAATLSNSAGRYLLCGATDRTYVSATAPGYAPARAVLDLRHSRTYDLVLIRR